MAADYWGVELVDALIWPVALLIIAGSLLLWPAAREGAIGLLGTFRHVKTPWFEFDLTEEGARQAREITAEGFSEYRRKVTAEYDRQVTIVALVERHQHLIRDFIEPALLLSEKDRPSFRCTLYVADVLFTETMYQLVDYFPRGGGKGRTFSARFGIVGRAWRLDSPVINSHVSTDPMDLVRSWGMNLQEATAAGEGRQSFAAIPLADDGGARVGVVYLDAVVEGVFGKADGDSDSDELATRLIEATVNGARETGLRTALINVMGELRTRGPAISLHEIGR